MSENKCCGNCKHFTNKDVDGCGFCTVVDDIVVYRESCEEHNYGYNSWTEITPDNVDEIKNIEKRVVVASIHHNVTFYRCLYDVNGLNSMAKNGGYFYYVLPKLKIE